MGHVEIIPAKPPEVAGVKKKGARVAAYCRVSRDTDQQQNSYESQVSFYTKFISEHEDWILAGIYADDGISGLTANKRNDFMRLMDDCKNGKVDLIITKSISRFARNLLDCVGYARRLKKLGIGVFFEEEHFSTLDDSAEFTEMLKQSPGVSCVIPVTSRKPRKCKKGLYTPLNSAGRSTVPNQDSRFYLIFCKSI